ncbi:MAG: tetratricopeptide repeat protein, partial [Planctomycetaceae bacterium]|nr:tetratricopeptide repeat protein [Planctomycetaceae bacterium]
CTKSLRVRNWVAKIARKVDPDPTGWRDRARNPLTLADETALIDVLHVAPVSENCVSLFLSLQLQLKPDSKQRLPFLQRVHHVHPDDYWVNQIIGETLLRENKPYEAIRHFRAAISIQPKTALCHHLLGFTLLTVGHLDEALRHTRMATDIKPDDILSQQLLGYILSELFRYDEAVDRLQVAVSINPNSPNLRSELGRFLEIQGQYTNALAQHQQAISLDPDNLGHQRELRNFLTRRGRQADALASWRANLDRGSVYGANWDGYAEFCLFVGQKEEFSRARQTLLAKFATQLDPLLTEKVALACLLLPGTNEEINQAAALAERSVAVYRIRSPGEYSVAPFAQGLAEYRLGKFDHAIETMQSEASKVLNPGHLLVLAMAQHQIGQKTEARKTLALAGLTHDWRAIRVRNQNDWILHSLRREAEQLILPDMAAFLAGKYQPQDNDERFSLLGVCQFNNRTLALARLYSDAFEVPEVMKSVGSIHRYSAARAAAHAGSGMSEDGKHLSDREQKQWRQQAHHWLKLELADMSQLLDKNVEADRRSTWTTLTRWTADSAIAGLREPGALQKLPAAERDGWSALWLDVERLRNQATHP